ncbi:MAG: hypothetical protein AAFQ94_31350 [Bacteroidota bacterium]
MKKGFKKKALKKAKNLLLDLLIVFIGVFLAFQLSAYREGNDVKKSRLNYYKAFRAEIKSVNVELTGIIAELDRQISRFHSDSLILQKPLLAYNNKINVVSQKPYIIESAFNSGNFRNLRYDLLASISGGSNLFIVLDEKIEDYNRRVKDLTYNRPYVESDYYTEIQLKPEYQWYLEEMKEVRVYATALKSSIENGAIPALNKLIDE